ncbi:NUDIX domain-containing protein [Ostreibacterium oceani]|uniref:ADP-ribose pyrophosphatase n=1 Tax=Ostreibacterium oceani TaxID=2654998 RepID=A0A6N7F4M1_9GAMM|nr:NUDIX domain-containing protein [Ostreibacterium oceani]MPV86836.1 NUDIX domain-containing protein [Ostreibacterium oceani]
MQYQVTLHDTQPCYEGFFKIYAYTVSFDRFTGGQVQQVIRECGKKHDVVAVLPYDPVRGEFLLVEQFRIGMLVRGEHPWTLEIVAGFMDVQGEDEVRTAQRELFEETGCEAQAVYPMTEYYSGPGGSAAKIKVYLATIDATTRREFTGIIEEGEDIRVHTVSVKEMYDAVSEGRLNNATSLIAFQQFFMHDWEGKIKQLASQ